MRISDWSSDVCSSDLTFGIGRVLELDHLFDDAVWPCDNAAIGQRIGGAEAKHHRRRAVRLVQPVQHPPHGGRGHQRNIAIEEQDIAIESGQHTLCLKHGMGGAKRSEEHTYELPSLMRISYAVF